MASSTSKYREWLVAANEVVSALSRFLPEKHRIPAVARRGIEKGAAVRVTPALYNTTSELDRLVRALWAESGGFL